MLIIHMADIRFPYRPIGRDNCASIVEQEHHVAMPKPSTVDNYRLLRQVNLNHLFYFWAVGQSGSITAAAARLGIAQPGVTNQLVALENRLGARLVERSSRGVSLTSEGQVAMRFAFEYLMVTGYCLAQLAHRD